jgi:hypothetical protein
MGEPSSDRGGYRAASFIARLNAARDRLAAHASRPATDGLTDPDPQSGERWTEAQVWGHLTEILPYWSRQVRSVLDARPEEPATFGRTLTDPDRLEGIARGTREPIETSWARLRDAIAELTDLLRSLDDRGWSARGHHVTLGEMEVEGIVESYMVGHLEAHADQLDALRDGGGTGLESA